MKPLKKSPPWVTYINEIKQLFKRDPDVSIAEKYSEDHADVRIGVTNRQKYAAFVQLLPSFKAFGDYRVNVDVFIMENREEKDTRALLKRMFDGNDVVGTIATLPIPGGEATYVSFQPDIAQFSDDNISDIYGNTTMLYEDIAREILNVPAGVFFCTEPI